MNIYEIFSLLYLILSLRQNKQSQSMVGLNISMYIFINDIILNLLQLYHKFFHICLKKVWMFNFKIMYKIFSNLSFDVINKTFLRNAPLS